MRRIGKLADESLARRFCDYLLTLSIEANADAETDEPGAEWNLWIRDENSVDKAREALTAFQAAPGDSRFQVDEEAARIRDEKIAEYQERAQQQRASVGKVASAGDVRQGLGPLLSGERRQDRIPVTIAIIVISVIAGFASNFDNPRRSPIPNQPTTQERIYDLFSFVTVEDYIKSGKDSFASIRRGEIWRAVTPMFLHGDTLHLCFNMLWIYFLGSVIERLHGSIFFLLLVLGTQIAGMAMQVLIPDAEFIPPALRGYPFAIGASGALYGLFGYLWIRPNLDPNYPVHLVPMNVVLMLGWLVACMTPLIPGVANGAHLGGLLAGMFAALLAAKIGSKSSR